MPEFKRATDAFTKWLQDRSVTISPKVEIADYRQQNQGRGVKAVEDIAEDEVLFTIPRSVLVNIDNCSLTKDYPEIRSKLLGLNQWESLIVSLLYELKAKKEQSEWYPYFNVLPILDDENYTFNQLMFWSEAELEYLSPSLITERVGKDIADAMFHKLYPKIIVEDLGIKELEVVKLSDYHKVASIIMSYSFDVDRPDFDSEDADFESEDEDDEDEDAEENGEEQEVKKSDKSKRAAKHVKKNHDHVEDGAVTKPEDIDLLKDGYFKSMVPLADTLNADTNLHNACLVYTESDLVMRSIKAIKKGDQIFNTYSDHPNSEILRRYGYVEPSGSKFDFGEIPITIIRDYFVNQTGLSADSIEEIFDILNEIVKLEQEDEEEMVEIVLDSYDCFKTSEVILELIFLIQILTIISSIHRINSIELLTPEAKFQLVSRIFKKSYQLIESKRLTKVFLANYEKILNIRLAQYSEIASEPFDIVAEFSRKKFADVVIRSEYQSLQNCLDIEKTFNTETGKYKFIDDSKFIKNIIKKRFSDDSTSEEENVPKRHRA